MSSTTPLTDSVMRVAGSMMPNAVVVGAPFARGLESDLVALRARIAEQDAEIARLRVGYDRYETVRRMNVQQFKDAWKLNIQTGKPFDEIIDQLRPFYFARKEQP